jgi:hypothetical protein
MGPLLNRASLLANLFTLPGKDDFHVVPNQPACRTQDDTEVVPTKRRLLHRPSRAVGPSVMGPRPSQANLFTLPGKHDFHVVPN